MGVIKVLDSLFRTTVDDIKSLKIQGAESIAKAAVDAFAHVEHNAYDQYMDAQAYAQALDLAKQELFDTRPTEPTLRNALSLLWPYNRKVTTISEMHDTYVKQLLFVREHFDRVTTALPSLGSDKIKEKDIIYTHCHSTSVMSVILDAHAQGKNITVNNTETRPRHQGRLTAADLAKHDVPVNHYIDSAMRLAIKNCTIVLLGADAIDHEMKVYNKIGSELVCETAKAHGKPVYICTDSWKFDPRTAFGYAERIEERSPVEVWDLPPKGVTVHNPAFEKINPKLITGIICELGIFTPKEFVKVVKETYPQLLK
ncbi:MAG TPA: hypothetical protein VK158_04600 [Acidobacteriota bacterium]|nr:hypothetical protein [Acidobacteriota bacterium]